MSKYIIQYHSRSPAALTNIGRHQKLPLEAWVFNFPANEVKMVLCDAIKQTDNTNIHTGLNIFASLNANSLEEAIETSRNFAETTLNLVSFSTLTQCNWTKLTSAINIVDKEGHPFRYYLYPFDEQGVIGSLSVVDESTFRALFDAYTRSSHQQRTLRALTWLRKGIGEENTIDEFISYWIGLEAIKHILSAKKTNAEEEWKEAEEIFTNLGFRDFKKIRHGARVGLIHGCRELDDKFRKEIECYLEPIRKTLVFCVGSVLGIADDTILTFVNKTPRRIRQSLHTALEGEVKSIPKDFDELVKNYPTIDAELISKEFSINERGEQTITFKVNHSFRGEGGYKWEVKATELWGDRDSGIKYVDFKG